MPGNHMTKHLDREVDRLRRNLVDQMGVVEQMVQNAVRSLVERRSELADRVIEDDALVDATDIQIEEECLKILALHQPVARPLRRITTVLKIIVDLERMADLACNIAERAESLQQFPFFPIPERLTEMVGQATAMVRMALDSFVDSDPELAKKVILYDAAVDENNRLVIEELKALMKQDTSLAEPALHCFSASRHIERIADLAENIAEDVIYLVDGEIVRHRHGNFAREAN